MTLLSRFQNLLAQAADSMEASGAYELRDASRFSEAVLRNNKHAKVTTVVIKVRGEAISREMFHSEEDALADARRTLQAYADAGYTAVLELP